jgi:hypothetical protein
MAVQAQMEVVRDARRLHFACVRRVVGALAKSKCKDGREALFAFAGRLANANAPRATAAFLSRHSKWRSCAAGPRASSPC